MGLDTPSTHQKLEVDRIFSVAIDVMTIVFKTPTRLKISFIPSRANTRPAHLSKAWCLLVFNLNLIPQKGTSSLSTLILRIDLGGISELLHHRYWGMSDRLGDLVASHYKWSLNSCTKMQSLLQLAHSKCCLRRRRRSPWQLGALARYASG